jgi:hypothetical protein
MNFYSLNQLSHSERTSILDKHRKQYEGYKSVWGQVSNEQPLYVQDYANDKDGIVVNNRGEVKPYTNFAINEQQDMMAHFEEEVTEDNMDEDIYDVEDLHKGEEFDYIGGHANLDEDDMGTYEPMESAFADELDEQGIVGLYDDIDFPAYDFKSKGPMQSQGPYGTSESTDDDDIIEPEVEDLGYVTHGGEFDMDDSENDELDRDTAFSRMKRMGGKIDIEDIDFEELDEDLRESFMNQKNKINEMFNRINRY